MTIFRTSKEIEIRSYSLIASLRKSVEPKRLTAELQFAFDELHYFFCLLVTFQFVPTLKRKLFSGFYYNWISIWWMLSFDNRFRIIHRVNAQKKIHKFSDFGPFSCGSRLHVRKTLWIHSNLNVLVDCFLRLFNSSNSTETKMNKKWSRRWERQVKWGKREEKNIRSVGKISFISITFHYSSLDVCYFCRCWICVFQFSRILFFVIFISF